MDSRTKDTIRQIREHQTRLFKLVPDADQVLVRQTIIDDLQAEIKLQSPETEPVPAYPDRAEPRTKADTRPGPQSPPRPAQREVG